MESISKRTGKKFSEKFSDTAVRIGIALHPGEEVIKPKAKVNRKKRTKKVK
jgi:hypothetical protein